ncbi:MAG: glyoxalase/bleomycin resistance protein/dioxygenase superfamily protein [Actinomycetia bacterium]|nr:glyoxalase/bleomycin resistance protein/dioxygenase superfamily protein [Actinomycetes bacterium]
MIDEQQFRQLMSGVCAPVAVVTTATDLDCIVDDALWQPGVREGARGLYNWGPPPPPSFLAPEDLAALMTAAHQPA